MRVLRLDVSAPEPDVAARVRRALVAAAAPRYECVAAGASDGVLEVRVTFWRASRRPGEMLAGGHARCFVPGEPPFFKSRFSMLTFHADDGPEQLGRWLAARLPYDVRQ